jgi:hypothetical protein
VRVTRPHLQAFRRNLYLARATRQHVSFPENPLFSEDCARLQAEVANFLADHAEGQDGCVGATRPHVCIAEDHLFSESHVAAYMCLLVFESCIWRQQLGCI